MTYFYRLQTGSLGSDKVLFDVFLRKTKIDVRSLRGLTVDDAKMNNVTLQPSARVDHCVLICTHMET